MSSFLIVIKPDVVKSKYLKASTFSPLTERPYCEFVTLPLLSKGQSGLDLMALDFWHHFAIFFFFTSGQMMCSVLVSIKNLSWKMVRKAMCHYIEVLLAGLWKVVGAGILWQWILSPLPIRRTTYPGHNYSCWVRKNFFTIYIIQDMSLSQIFYQNVTTGFLRF